MQSTTRSKLLCCLVIATLCNSGNARHYDRRREASPLIPSHHALLVATRLSGGALTDREEERREPSRAFFGATRVGNTMNRYYDSLANRLANGRIREAVLSSEKLAKRSAQYAPSVLSGAYAVLNRPDRSGLSLLSIYILTLLGTSVGFHTFLYFITVGYGAGIGIPVALSLICNTQPMPPVATLHAVLVLIWSLRMVSFLLWRELVNWPALHKKLSQVNEQHSPDTMVKALCWIFYSLAYFCVASPCWFSMQTAMDARGAMSWLGILLQVLGLVLETVADWQKSTFKASSPGNRYRWCREGLWNYSTHPNYAGEWIFWLGTLSVGLEAVASDAKKSTWTKLLQTGVMITGFGFITATFRMNVLNMDRRLEEKYGESSDYDTGFSEFRQQCSVFGPRWWKSLKNGTPDSSFWWHSTKTDGLKHFFGALSDRIESLQSSSKNVTNVLSEKMKSLIEFNSNHSVTINDDSSSVEISQHGNSSEVSTEGLQQEFSDQSPLST